MNIHTLPKFHNSMGVETIEISTKKFECIGAHPPLDHPHVFLDMGERETIKCPYCATTYFYNPKLPRGACLPKEALE